MSLFRTWFGEIRRSRFSPIADIGEGDRFAETFYKGSLDTHDRARLEGLVRHAVGRFEMEDDEGRKEELRQHLKSDVRFYSFHNHTSSRRQRWLRAPAPELR